MTTGTIRYAVSGMHCEHCARAVTQEIVAVDGVTVVDADLETKLVTVSGEALDDGLLRSAIEAAGYEAA